MEVDENVIKIKLESLENSCRVCITSNSEMSEIFNEEHSEIIEKIEFCSGISLKPQNGLPTQICSDCLQNLTVAHEFKTKCIFTDNILQTIHDRIKTEPIDHEDNDCTDVVSQTEFDTEVKEEIESGESCEQSTKRCTRSQAKEQKQTETTEQMKTDLYDEGNNNIENAVSSAELVQDEYPSKQKKKKCKRKQVKKPKQKKTTKQKKPIVDEEIVQEIIPKIRNRAGTVNQCKLCNLKFQNRTEMILHKRELHWGRKEFFCEVCGKLCSSFTYNTHVWSHGKNRYNCDYCEYGTSHKGSLVSHIIRHLGIKKRFKCDLCPGAYYSGSCLKTHKRRVHDRERNHCCTICDKRFFDKTKLNLHIDTHNGVKRFECSLCIASFSRRYSLKAHLLKEHNISTPRSRPGRPRMTHDIINN